MSVILVFNDATALLTVPILLVDLVKLVFMIWKISFACVDFLACLSELVFDDATTLLTVPMLLVDLVQMMFVIYKSDISDLSGAAKQGRYLLLQTVHENHKST